MWRLRPALPASSIAHRLPWLGWCQGITLLKQLDRDAVWRPDKGHVPVPWWPVDGHPGGHQLFAQAVYVIYAIGKMTKIPAAGIGFRVPVVSQLKCWRSRVLIAFLVTWGAQEVIREATLFTFNGLDEFKAKQVAIEMQ